MIDLITLSSKNCQGPMFHATIKAPKLFPLNILFDETSAVYINIYAVKKTTVSHALD